MGSPNPPESDRIKSELGNPFQRGPRGVPGYHFRLILEMFWRYFNMIFGCILIDVGGMFASQWDVF